jgi:hypothetical protein
MRQVGNPISAMILTNNTRRTDTSSAKVLLTR